MAPTLITKEQVYHEESVYFADSEGHLREVRAIHLWGEVQYLNFAHMVQQVGGSYRSFLRRTNKDELFLFEFGKGIAAEPGLYISIREAQDLLQDSRAPGAARLFGALGSIIVDRFMRATKIMRQNGISPEQSFSDFLDREKGVDDLTAFLDSDE